MPNPNPIKGFTDFTPARVLELLAEHPETSKPSQELAKRAYMKP